MQLNRSGKIGNKYLGWKPAKYRFPTGVNVKYSIAQISRFVKRESKTVLDKMHRVWYTDYG